ncbi:hypothetical protein RHSIM_Rhsim07G0079300 [Rhododendron simsii]|uniref:LRAT domain-containing protein n=1 Tax=Rhododendron simsii TaxID=118357 RepID=A0A834LK24_RHOSS|nr:hypothetical protein RHSIM_Rhsim07G0079300 [Rhododendron simsii]
MDSETITWSGITARILLCTAKQGFWYTREWEKVVKSLLFGEHCLLSLLLSTSFFETMADIPGTLLSEYVHRLLITKAEGEEKEGRAEMGLFSNRVERSEIVAGDHIYTWRNVLIYAHHGIYIGDGLVIHFTVPPDKLKASSPFASLSSSSSAPRRGQQRTCPNRIRRCGGPKPGGGVAVICLDCFIGKGNLYRYEYEVPQLEYIWFRRPGTCTDDKSEPASTVIQRANSLLEKGFGNYHLQRKNCEDFALYCKTGILKIGGKGVGMSGQIIGRLPLAGRIAMMKTASRRDVIKVPVEDMDKFHHRLITV